MRWEREHMPASEQRMQPGSIKPTKTEGQLLSEMPFQGKPTRLSAAEWLAKNGQIAEPMTERSAIDMRDVIENIETETRKPLTMSSVYGEREPAFSREYKLESPAQERPHAIPSFLSHVAGFPATPSITEQTVIGFLPTDEIAPNIPSVNPGESYRAPPIINLAYSPLVPAGIFSLSPKRISFADLSIKAYPSTGGSIVSPTLSKATGYSTIEGAEYPDYTKPRSVLSGGDSSSNSPKTVSPLSTYKDIVSPVTLPGYSSPKSIITPKDLVITPAYTPPRYSPPYSPVTPGYSPPGYTPPSYVPSPPPSPPTYKPPASVILPSLSGGGGGEGGGGGRKTLKRELFSYAPKNLQILSGPKSPHWSATKRRGKK
jgi:hypothetical protein